MNSPNKFLRIRSQRGTAMLLALLVVFGASFVLAGWAMLLAARTLSAEEAPTAQKRRVAIQNSRSIGMQWARQAMGSGTITNVSVSLTNDWGRFTAATVANSPMTFEASDSRINHFGPLGISGFSLPISTTISGGTFTNTNIFFFRSRSPILGGYPLVLQTNTVTNANTFTGLAVSGTGAMALVYPQAFMVADAPVASTYNSFTNRTVVTSVGGSTQASMTAAPYAPMASGSSGATNAFAGVLPATPLRSFTINDLTGSVASAFAALPATPYLSEYTRLGDMPVGIDFEDVSLTGVETSHGPSSMVSVGGVPDDDPQVSGSNKITYYYYGKEFEVKYASDNVQYWKSPSWETINASSEILIFNKDGTISVQNLNTTTSIELGANGSERTVLFSLPPGKIMVVNGTRMYFTGTSGYSTTAQNGQGCALFRTSELFQPNGVAFLLLSDSASDRDFMDFLFNNPSVAREWQSYIYRADVPVGGGRYVRLIELNINDDYTVYDYPSNNAARQPMLIIDPNASNAANGNRRFSLAVADANSRPVLHHMESSTLSGWSWRKVFSLFSASSLAGAGTYLRFSYLDPSELNVNLAAGSGSRPTVMNVLGGGGNGTLTTPGASTWNLTATFVDTRLTLAPGGALNIVGGLRVNRNTTVSTNSVNFLWNTNVSNPPLDVFADRVGWVETWQQ